jgi:hypothetical protein
MKHGHMNFSRMTQSQENSLGQGVQVHFFHKNPTILHLFHLFWPHTLLCKIVTETNHYATHPMDAQGNCMEGSKWKNLTIAWLKAFLTIHMYMEMKRQPNMKSYWEREGSFFHCPTISNIMTRERFKELVRCLHIKTRTLMYTLEGGTPVMTK